MSSYTLVGIDKACISANELLEAQGSDERFRTSEIYKMVTIYIINQSSQETRIVYEHISRQEAYYWFSGVNSALMNK